MAQGFRQEAVGSSVDDSPAANYTVTLASDTIAGNQVIICVSSHATVATPSGFTLDRSQVNSTGNYVFRKASVAETASWTIDPAGSNAAAWWVAEVTGLDTSPVDQVISEGTTGGDDERSTGTTGTTSQADEWLLTITGLSSDDGAGIITVDATGSWTNSFVFQDDEGATNVGFYVSANVATRTVSSTGTFETTSSFTSAQAAAILVTYTIAAVAAVYPPFPRRQNTLVRM